MPSSSVIPALTDPQPTNDETLTPELISLYHSDSGLDDHPASIRIASLRHDSDRERSVIAAGSLQTPARSVSLLELYEGDLAVEIDLAEEGIALPEESDTTYKTFDCLRGVCIRLKQQPVTVLILVICIVTIIAWIDKYLWRHRFGWLSSAGDDSVDGRGAHITDDG